MDITDPVEYQYYQALTAEIAGRNQTGIPDNSNVKSGKEQPFANANDDSVLISPEALALFNAIENSGEDSESKPGADGEEDKDGFANEKEIAAGSELGDCKETKANGEALSEQEKKKVQELRERDQEVRTHEQAHKAAAGGLPTSGPGYEYQTGPDGQQYAVGGEVSIGMPDSDDPRADLRNAQQLERAALAPAEPSAQDRKVASSARQKQTKARQEIADEQSKSLKTEEETTPDQMRINITDRESGTDNSVANEDGEMKL